MVIGGRNAVYTDIHWTTQFFTIFQCQATMVIASLGRLIAVLLGERGRRVDPTSSSEVPSV
jgi:hypothetical protein